jgi:hypothetical protein
MKKEKPFKSKICEKELAVASKLKTHVKIVHENPKQFKCYVRD